MDDRPPGVLPIELAEESGDRRTQWTNTEHYDVVAHIDETTAAEWLKLAPLQRQQPGRLMLQKLLAERCKLLVHLIPTQVEWHRA